jgi:hypothetical protein
MQLAPVSSKEKQGVAQPSTPHAAERAAAPGVRFSDTSAIVTTRRPKAAASLPPGLLADTPEEHRRRGDAADALWRELGRRIREDR